MNADVNKSRETGFAAHLTKPIDFRRLEAVVVEIFSAGALAEVSTRPRN